MAPGEASSDAAGCKSQSVLRTRLCCREVSVGGRLGLLLPRGCLVGKDQWLGLSVLKGQQQESDKQEQISSSPLSRATADVSLWEAEVA